MVRLAKLLEYRQNGNFKKVCRQFSINSLFLFLILFNNCVKRNCSHGIPYISCVFKEFSWGLDSCQSKHICFTFITNIPPTGGPQLLSWWPYAQNPELMNWYNHNFFVIKILYLFKENSLVTWTNAKFANVVQQDLVRLEGHISGTTRQKAFDELHYFPKCPAVLYLCQDADPNKVLLFYYY